MEKKKLLYIISDVNKSLAFEWIASNLDKQKFHLHFILISQQQPDMLDWLKEQGIACDFLSLQGKKSFPNLLLKLIKIVWSIKPDIVHTHLFNANLLGLLAAVICRIKMRIYTRHHSSFHHEIMPKAVKWDKLSNRLSTDIVAISKNVKSILIDKEGVDPKKIHLIHHGFDLEAFANPNKNDIEELRIKYQLESPKGPVVGLIARQIKWKGIQFIIPAFKELLEKNPKAILVLANASGPNHKEIVEMLKKELSPENYREIKFEPKLFALYQLFDLFVHVPINKSIEAFGQVYIESLAAGVPSVFTLSGVANEFIVHEENALVVDYSSSESIYSAMKRILEDEELRNRLVQSGLNSLEPFKLDTFIKNLNALYER